MSECREDHIDSFHTWKCTRAMNSAGIWINRRDHRWKWPVGHLNPEIINPVTCVVGSVEQPYPRRQKHSLYPHFWNEMLYRDKAIDQLCYFVFLSHSNHFQYCCWLQESEICMMMILSLVFSSVIYVTLTIEKWRSQWNTAVSIQTPIHHTLSLSWPWKRIPTAEKGHYWDSYYKESTCMNYSMPTNNANLHNIVACI